MKRLFSTMLAVFAVACGGSEPGAKAPTGKAAASEAAPVEREAASESEAEEKPQPAARRCADGTCFACGAGYCPSGFYCDESAKGGASCSWLPACTGKSECGCLSRALSGCKCDSGDGPHVRCD